MDKKLALIATNISKSFMDGLINRVVLRDVNLSVSRGEKVLLTGSSGSGKSTLLQILGLINRPTSGTIEIANETVDKNSQQFQIDKILKHHLGFVFQNHHLLNDFTALENLILPQLLLGTSKAEATENAIKMLDRINVLHRADARPSRLSGGERQRVAVARALIKKPTIILADEPTGNLDRNNAMIVLEEMLQLASETLCAIIMVTHDNSIVPLFDTHYNLVNGQLTKYDS